MKCLKCCDTGSLSRDLHGEIDCANCDTALERAGFNAWVRANVPGCDLVDAWLIRQYVLGERPAVTRYSEEYDYEGGNYLCPSEDGEWVQYEDVKHLLADYPA